MSESAPTPPGAAGETVNNPRRNAVMGVVAILAGAATYALMPEDMAEGTRRMAVIFAVALVLWVTEAIPLFATSLLVVAAEAWWIAVPADLGVEMAYTEVFNALTNPVILLFLGGFIMAKAVQQERIDVQMAGLMLRAFGRRPIGVLAGVMLVTAVFSMWMSNTATTAMMMVLVHAFVRQMGAADRFRYALVLGVPFAANIGGIATPIGTPPNAIAMGQLADRGLGVSFVEWMVVATPLMLVTLVLLWLGLYAVYRPEAGALQLEVRETFALTRKAAIVYGTFVVTVLLWLTSAWHGVPTAVVALVPAAVLTLTSVIGKKDFNNLDWNILVLIGGGIALGDGMTATGLDAWVVRLMPTEGVSFYAIVAATGLAAVAMSTVVSNTVAANILLPVGLAVLGTGAMPEQYQVIAIITAIMASYAMGLPISTPPNAIAYGSGLITSRDMLRVGGLTSVLASILVLATGPAVVRFLLR